MMNPVNYSPALRRCLGCNGRDEPLGADHCCPPCHAERTTWIAEAVALVEAPTTLEQMDAHVARYRHWYGNDAAEQRTWLLDKKYVHVRVMAADAWHELRRQFPSDALPALRVKDDRETDFNAARLQWRDATEWALRLPRGGALRRAASDVCLGLHVRAYGFRHYLAMLADDDGGGGAVTKKRVKRPVAESDDPPRRKRPIVEPLDQPRRKRPVVNQPDQPRRKRPVTTTDTPRGKKRPVVDASDAPRAAKRAKTSGPQRYSIDDLLAESP
jgi:hypothetical protein